MSQKLKPCPFCGSDDVTVKGAEITGPNPYVYCRKCHTHGPQRISYQGAANAWNFRADEPKRIDGKPAGMSAEQFDACYDVPYAIIGNIYDNPGLLEAKNARD